MNGIPFLKLRRICTQTVKRETHRNNAGSRVASHLDHLCRFHPN